MARSIGRVGEGGGKLNRRLARGELNPCARKPKARTGRFVRGKLIPDHTESFLSTRAHKKGGTGKIIGAFKKDTQSFGQLDAGSCASFTGSRPPPPMDLDTTIFQISA